jgi:hypothetical protein
VDLFKKHAQLIRSGGQYAKGVGPLEARICVEITAERTKSWHTCIATTRKWPIKINLTNVPERIIAMKEELDKVMTVMNSHEQFTVWEYLKEDLESVSKTVDDLARMKTNATPIKLTDHARPG